MSDTETLAFVDYNRHVSSSASGEIQTRDGRSIKHYKKTTVLPCINDLTSEKAALKETYIQCGLKNKRYSALEC